MTQRKRQQFLKKPNNVCRRNPYASIIPIRVVGLKVNPINILQHNAG
jgi:hypothetical protein